MTETLSRPTTSGSPPRRSAARPGFLRAGLPAAGWAATAGLVTVAVPVLLLWAADSRTAAGAGEALRTVAQVWLVAHGTTLAVPGGALGLTPLALMALPLLLLFRAARSAATQVEVATLGEAARLAAGVAGPYALAAALVAGLARSQQVQPAPLQALVGASVLGLLGAGLGVVRAAGLGPALRDAVPPLLRRAAVPAAAALLVLLAVGSLLVGVSLAVHGSQAVDLARAATPGLFGGVGLFLIGLLLVPNAVLWGACYLVGPGFAVGVSTAVGPFGVQLGATPSVPLLAALPGSDLPGWVGVLVLLVPCAAGFLAGRAAQRAGTRLRDALLAGPLVGIALALLAGISGGPLGGRRLTDVGPSWWQVGLAATLEVTLGVAALACVQRLRVHLAARTRAADEPALAATTAGPSATGPSATGPSATGPSSAGPSSAGPSAAGPSAAE